MVEVKNHNTGEIVRMRGDAPLPAGGAVTMVGWRSRNGIFVDKLIFGAPSVQAGIGAAQPSAKAAQMLNRFIRFCP